jgi:(p)ppGpp synthase/HD superfamily hydrolase
MPHRPPLSPRFAAAAAWVCELHREQTRKGTDTPYVAHLFGVASLALEHGADEDEAIAALLHDGPEDQGGRETLAAVESRFGGRVAAIVDACTDTYEEPKPPWRERKERHLAHLREASPSARLVALADKVYNLRAIVRDYRELGEELWSRFRSRSGPDVVWYYRSVLEVLGGEDAEPRVRPLLADLAGELDALEREIAATVA